MGLCLIFIVANTLGVPISWRRLWARHGPWTKLHVQWLYCFKAACVFLFVWWFIAWLQEKVLPGTPSVRFFKATLLLKPATIALKIGYLACRLVKISMNSFFQVFAPMIPAFWHTGWTMSKWSKSICLLFPIFSISLLFLPTGSAPSLARFTHDLAIKASNLRYTKAKKRVGAANFACTKKWPTIIHRVRSRRLRNLSTQIRSDVF